MHRRPPPWKYSQRTLHSRRLGVPHSRRRPAGASFPPRTKVCSIRRRLTLALLDVQATDADAAVAAGWANYRPVARRPLRITTPQAPHNGWEERQVSSYETSPNEKAVIYALAWRAGRDWTVVIVEASRSTFE